MKFRDMKTGDRFEAWGDQIANYNFPKACIFEKIGEDTAVEILGEEGNRRGIQCLVDGRDEYRKI